MLRVMYRSILLILFFSLPSCLSLTPQKSQMIAITGKIVESKVEKKWKYRSVYMGHDDFHVIIKYEYEINGITYVNNRISYWYTSYNSQKKAEKSIEQYPVGKVVTVYYKKDDPKDSFLEVEDDTVDGENE